ncbi:DUF4199 domain-containing protein [Carboxylicivirga caseinilyticus]|uniref:DUF4199 domain-containing protein n=1 Tax=Carboxylicivirga caseinilyticus TaxID=3417572 RepID=UPI003D343603|nr:DUF4199 domain-containing protein [Marinilabiliaceae bacterium A049]
MEKTNAPWSKTALTYGIYLGVISILYSVIIYVAGMIGNKPLSYVSYLITIGILIWAMLTYRDKVNGGYMSYGTGVGLGFMTALIGGILGSIFSYILMTVIDPSIPDQLFNMAIEEAIAKNPEVEQNLDMVEGMMRKMMSPTALALFGVVGSAIGGVIISLILAAIFKKDKPMFEEAQAE